jgi:TPR repeat protein
MKQFAFFLVFMLSNIGLIFAQTPSMSNDKEKIVNTLNKTFLDLYMDSDTSNLSIIEKESLFLKNVSNNLNDDFKKNIDILPILDIFDDETFLKNIKFDAKPSDLYGLAVSNFINQESQYIDHIKLKNDEIKNGKSPFQENLQKSSFTDSLQLYFNIQDTEDANAKLMSYHTIEQNFKSFSNLLEKDKNVLIDQKMMIQYIQLTHSVYALQPKKINHLINQILLEHHDQDLKKEAQNLFGALDEYGNTYDEIVNENVNDAKRDENKLKYFKFKKWLKNGFLEFLIQRMYQNSKVSRLKEQVFQIASQYTENTSDFVIKKNRANQRFLIRCLYAAYYHFMIESELLTDYEIKNAKPTNISKQVDDDRLEILKLYNGDQICLNHPDCTLETLGKSKNINMEEVNGKIQILCEVGKYEYCGLLGYFHYQGYLVEKNLDLSFKYFKYACEIADQQRSCLFLGILYADEKFGKKDLEKSKQILDGICEKNKSQCEYIANQLSQNKLNTPTNNQVADKHHQINDDFYDENMVALLNIYNGGQICITSNECTLDTLAYNVSIDIEKIKKVCVNGKSEYCGLLGYFHYQGYLVEKNLDLSFKYFKDACDANHKRSCVFLGILYGERASNQYNQEQSIELLTLLCDQEEGYACKCLSINKEENGKMEEARILLVKSCDLGHSTSCLSLGEQYKNQHGIHFLNKACDLDNGIACRMLGLQKSKEKKHDEAIILYQKACNLNNSSGCLILGYLEEGKDNFEERKALVENAIMFYQKSCDLNLGIGCVYLGQLKDKKGQKDEAILLYKKACDLNDGEGCRKLGDVKFQTNQADEAILLYQKACTLKIADACKYLEDSRKRR